MEQKVKFSIEDVGGDAKNLSFSSTNPTMSKGQTHNEPYNPLSYASAVRSALHILKLSVSMSQQSPMLKENAYNIDLSSTFLGNSSMNSKNCVTAEAVKELKKSSESVRATKPTRSVVCQSRSLNYMPIIRGNKTVLTFFKIKDKKINSNLLTHQYCSVYDAPICVVFAGLKVSEE